MPRSILLLLVALSASGCNTESCLDPLSRTCNPAYEPTFDNIYTNTLQPTCARSGSSCHAPEGAQNGVSFGTVDQAHQVLTGQVDGVRRVLAGDPECSIMVQRLESREADIRMPPDGPISEGERCAIILWVANGASR